MTVSRDFKWECNKCGQIEFRRAYGFPRGWLWIREDKRIHHRCPLCQDDMDKTQKNKGRPEKIAEEEEARFAKYDRDYFPQEAE